MTSAAHHDNPDDHTAAGSPPHGETMQALLLGTEAAQLLEISRNHPGRDIARLVGDPLIDRMSHLTGLDIWVGDNSLATHPVNDGASRFLAALLQAVLVGDYTASEHDRAHVARLVRNPGWAPVIAGPALVTGVDDNGDTCPLPEAFTSWLHRMFRQASDAQQAAVNEVLGQLPQVLRQLGLSPERELGGITIFDLP
ncbi:hypothetical protein [Amycolatopsis thermoflava]|uniref:hypothetical protein n=1 Tax=Amycolatopsis thermoflava TaxID=84480 RepID=UPI003826ED4C